MKICRAPLLRKKEDFLIVKPVTVPSVLELLDSWEPLEEDLPEVEDPPPIDDVELSQCPPEQTESQ